ncbi:MAG: multicopper oxidase domain-containing protein [Paracoccaceae bacterium]|nr:multicopper oxidase domain-containing protein [Paracoccaceae bacterium]
MRPRILVSCAFFGLLAAGLGNAVNAAGGDDKGWPPALPLKTQIIPSGIGAGCQFYTDPNKKELERYHNGNDPTNTGKNEGKNKPKKAYMGMRYPGGTAYSSTDYIFSTILPGGRDYVNPLDATNGPARSGGPNDFAADPSARELGVMYQEFNILGCNARLRQYVLGEESGGTVTYPQKPFPFGPTFSFAPDTALNLNIVNRLPEDDHDGHEQHAGHEGFDISGASSHGVHPAQSTPAGYVPPFPSGVGDAFKGIVHNLIHDLNHTNIHTHGFHVDPTGNSDNVFVNITPGGAEATEDSCGDKVNNSCYHEQYVHLPPDHPGGTFWYHAHMHGATAVQVSGGMAGGLVVRDAPGKGLDSAPSVAGAIDMFLGLQQMPYDDQGQVEGIYFIQEAAKQTASTCDAGAKLANRPRLINGVPVPTINVKLNQTYRWRFLHSGSIGQIYPQVTTLMGTQFSVLNDMRSDGKTIPTMDAAPKPGDDDYDSNLAAFNAKYFVPLWEMETDGLPTGGLIPKPQIDLSPAYRSAALFYVTQEMLDGLSNVEYDPNTQTYTLYLVDNNQSPTAAATQCLRNADGTLQLKDGKPISTSVTIGNLRRVMAIIKVDASDPVMLECCEPLSQFAEAQASYTSPGWDASEAFNPEKDFGYEGIGPLAPISDEELEASRFRSAEYRVSTGDMIVDEPIARVHYYGDGPNTNAAYDGLYGALYGMPSGSSYTDYACPDTGGACTYCGGTKALVTLPDGTKYLATTARNIDPICGPVQTGPAIEQPTEASKSDYAAPNRLPWVNFMICTGPTLTDLRPAVSRESIPQVTDKKKFIFDASSGKAVDNQELAIREVVDAMDDLTVTVWDCMKFNEESDFTRWVTLNSANQWSVSSKGNQATHVFHIHVNPFTLKEPYATSNTLDFHGKAAPDLDIWKDTLVAPPLGSANPVNFDGGELLKTRYTLFPGAYVQHCHVLTHEDQGMMQVVSVADSNYVARLKNLTGALTEFELREILTTELMSVAAEDVRTAGPELLQLIDILPPPAE